MFNFEQHKNKIIHADCNDIMADIPDKYFDYTFTSPPYNRKRNDKYDNYDDCVDDYFGWLCGVMDNLLRVTKKHVIFNIQKTYYNKKDVFDLIGKYSDKIQEIIIWEKTNPMPANNLNITNAYEFFIILGNESLKANKSYTKNIISTSVHSSMPKNHKAVMKPDVCEWFIENFTKEKESVFDCFSGMGTTAMACYNLNRNFLAIEKDEDYYKASCDRLEILRSQGTLF